MLSDIWSFSRHEESKCMLELFKTIDGSPNLVGWAIFTIIMIPAVLGGVASIIRACRKNKV